MQGDELAVRMREALQKGRLGISALSPRITTGKEQWQEWHHDFFHNQMQDFIQDDVKLHERADEMNTDLEVITLREARQTALEVRPSTAVRVLQGFTELHAEAIELEHQFGCHCTACSWPDSITYVQELAIPLQSHPWATTCLCASKALSI